MFFFILNGPFGLQLGPTQGEVLCRGVAGGGGGPGVPVTPLGRPSFDQTTYNIQVAKTT